MLIGKLVDAEHMIYAVVKAMDHIERNESGNNSLATAIGLVLAAAGYDEVMCYAAAVMTAAPIEQTFSDALWSTRGAVERTALLMGAVKAAMDIIEGGKIDEAIRSRTAEILAEAKRHKPGTPGA